MLDVEDFSAVFRGLNYSPGLVSEIQEYRTALGGRTYFERLLELLKIKGGTSLSPQRPQKTSHLTNPPLGRKLYPPQTPQQLSDLHTLILSAPTSLHNKHCLLFYLLKDLSPSYHDRPELSASFAKNVHLDSRFWTFIEGIWALDHAQYSVAVSHLTHPSIIPTFPDEILSTLLRAQNALGSPSPRKNGIEMLPLAYFDCVNPPLEDKNVRREWARYLALRNVGEMYTWLHSRPAHEQEDLLEILVQNCLENNSSTPSQHNDASSRAEEFVQLPLSQKEDEWLEYFLTKGKGRTLQNALDTVLLRRIARGRLAGMAGEMGVRGMRVEGVNWEILREGVKKGLGPRMSEEDGVMV
jgi:hypothetical protein